MNTLILNGSPRKSGLTSAIIGEMEESLSSRGRVEHIRIYNQSIAPCVGCLKCRPDKYCVLPDDDAQRIAQLIEGADTVVLASPTYWGNITGPMKTLFDRLVTTFEYLDRHSLPKKNLKGKKAERLAGKLSC